MIIIELDKNYIIYELENQIGGLLRQEYLPEERPIERIFQIIYEPSFEEKVSWEMFKTLKQENMECYFAVKSVWDKAEDCSKLDIPLVALKAKYNKGQIIPTIKREKIYIEKKLLMICCYNFRTLKFHQYQTRQVWDLMVQPTK